MTVSYVVDSYPKFAEMPDSLCDRLSHKATDNFFQSIDWFSCLAQFGFVEAPDLRLFVCHDRAQDDRRSYLLCLREDVKHKRLTSLSNYYTIRYPGVVEPDNAPKHAVRAIVDAIASETSAWSEVQLRSLAASDAGTDSLRSAFERAGYRVGLNHQFWNWFIKVDGSSYRDYLSGRPTRLRNTLRRRGLQMATRHRVRFADFRDRDHLDAGLKGYAQVYERSWKPPEVTPIFVPELIQLCADLGILRLGMLYLDEVPVATQFWICSDGISYIYKLAQDPKYNDLSVGSLLTAHMFEQAIDVDRVSEIDFGVGDEAYKRDWTDTRRQLVDLQAINPRTLRGSLLSLRLSIRDALRRAGLRRYTPVRLTLPESGGTQIP